MAWSARIVDQTGALTSEWAGTVVSVSDVENGHGGCTLRGGLHDVGNDEWVRFADGTYEIGDLATHEVQLVRTIAAVDTTAAWMVPTSINIPDANIDIGCAGLSSLFERRTIGKALRTNQIDNPDFEAAVGAEWEDINCTMTRDDTHSYTGGWALQLDSRSDPDAFASQSFTSPSNGVGILWVATAWVYLNSYGSGAALENRGLYLERLDGAVVQEARWDPITETTPNARWIRLRTMIQTPPDSEETIRLRLYATGSVLWWDNVHVVSMESHTYSETSRVDVITAVVAAGQDTTLDKDDLDITVDADTGTDKVSRSYQWAEHVYCWDAIRELVDSAPDVGVRMLPGTRTFRIDQPRHSATVSPVVLRFGPTSPGVPRPNEIIRWPLSVDFGRGFNQPILQSDIGDGVDREEVAVLATGRVFETVQAGPTGSTLDSLQGLAQNMADVWSWPVTLSLDVARTVDVDLVESWIAGDFVMGDLVSVDIRTGAYAIAHDYRCVAMSIDCTTEVVTLTLNVV